MKFSISIHTPLAGSDTRTSRNKQGGGRISIHTPLAGSDSDPAQLATVKVTFQSTLPSRGVTVLVHLADSTRQDFNPHSPRGE